MNLFLATTLILAWALVVTLNGILVLMKVRANASLAKDQKLSLWPRIDYVKAIQIYREHYPESNLPNILNALQYSTIALLVGLVPVLIYLRIAKI